jgi:Cdc6-like AAA superfamily ATPase
VQSTFEQLSQMNPHNKPPMRVKVSLILEAVDKDLERRINRRVPEILQLRPAPRLGAQRVAFQQP